MSVEISPLVRAAVKVADLRQEYHETYSALIDARREVDRLTVRKGDLEVAIEKALLAVQVEKEKARNT